MTEPGRPADGKLLEQYPRIGLDEAFDFACAGCGDCCRERRDLVLSGLDLYRLARRLGLPPRIVAGAFCREEIGPDTLLPALRLAPKAGTGNCPFLDGGACSVHAARPLACALYPLGQSIDLNTFRVEYYVQTPVCGAKAGGRTLRGVLDDAGVDERLGTDLRWAAVCSDLSRQLFAAGGAENLHYRTAVRRIASALYYDYSLGDEFYPQFCANIQTLQTLLPRILA